MHKDRPRKIAKSTTKRVNPQEKPVIRIIILVAWLFFGLYVGAAAWTGINFNSLLTKADNARSAIDCDDPAHEWLDYKGTSYCVVEEIRVEQQLELMENLSLDWIFYLPDPLPLILSAFSFGVLGGLIRILRNRLYQKKPPSREVALNLPLMAGVTALMLLGISYIFPMLFTQNNILLKPEVQPFLSIFAGVFSDHLQKWFQTVIERNFSVAKESH
jgi:hypothetical protein